MRRTLTVVAAIAAVTSAPGAASASPPAAAECRLVNLAQRTITGGHDTFTGIAAGWVVSATPGEAVSVYCEVRVNGASAATTSAGTGTNAAASTSQVTYTASVVDDVQLCAVWSSELDSGEVCTGTILVAVIPAAALDAACEDNPEACGLLCNTIPDVEPCLAYLDPA